MLKKRIIPVILFKDGYIVQSVNFNQFQNLGDPFSIIKRLSKWMSDEIIYLNISNNRDFKNFRTDLKFNKQILSFSQIIKYISENLICPITYGGNINTIKDIEKYLRYGADKVSINSAAINNVNFIEEASKEFGSQCILVSIDYLKIDNKYFVVSKGRKITNIDIFDHLKACCDHGCGEILLNSVERDGLKKGYDLEIINKVINKINIPLIVLGGAGNSDHFVEAFSKTKITSLAAANLFNHIEHGDFKIKKDLNEYFNDVRKPNFFETQNKI